MVWARAEARTRGTLTLRTMGCAMALALAAGAARAATVSYTLQEELDVVGEDMAFAFTSLPLPNPAGGGTVTVATAGGNGFPGVDVTTSVEFFDLTVDGASQGRYSCGGGPGVTAIPGATSQPAGSDCTFSLPVALGAAGLAALLDGALTVGVLFSGNVGAFPENDDLIVVTLSYDAAEVAPIPLPASGLLLVGALGAAGLAARRRAG